MTTSWPERLFLFILGCSLEKTVKPSAVTEIFPWLQNHFAAAFACTLDLCYLCNHIIPARLSRFIGTQQTAEGETPYMCLSTGLKQSRTQSGFTRWSRQRLHDSKGIALGFTDWLKNQHIFVVTVLQFNHAQRIKQRLHSFLFN